MFVLSNSQCQSFYGAKFRLQKRLELHLCFFDVIGLFKCFLQQPGRFKPDAECVGTPMKGHRKERRTGETICRGRETKIALTAGSSFADCYDCFSGSERGLTVNAPLG